MEFKGSIKISQDIVTNIIGITVSEIEGVYFIIGYSPNTLINIKNKDNSGIVVDYNENSIVVTLSVILDKNYIITEVCEKIQTQVIEKVKTMTDLVINQVNIYVAGII